MKHKTCCICKGAIEFKEHNGVVYWKHGENAEPVATGQCCGKCHDEYVVPVRLSRIYNRTEAITFLGEAGITLP